MYPKDRIWLPVDVPDVQRALALVQAHRDNVGVFKLGLQVLNAALAQACPGYFFDEYNRMLVDGEFFDSQAEKFGINTVVMGVQDDPNIIRPFMLRLIQNPRWVPVYADGRITILLKNNEKNKKIVDAFKITLQ